MSLETKIKLRSFVTSDAGPLIDLLNSGIGALVGEPGIITALEFAKIREGFSAEQVITAERQLKTYVVGYAAIKNYNIAARRAELWVVCVAPTKDRSVPDKKTVSAVLDWAFGGLGLNKVTIDVLETNQIMSSLEENGFVSEGLKKSQYRAGTRYVDAAVMGCLAGGRPK